MIKPTELNKYTMILMKQVIKKVNNGEITIKELSKKTGYKISSINGLLKGHFINFQEATKLCKASDINIYDYIDKDELDSELLKEYNYIYGTMNDENKLMIISDMENSLKIKSEDRTYQTSKRLLDRMYRELYLEKNITINELIEKTGYSPLTISFLLQGESTFFMDRKICKILGLKYNNYIDYESMEPALMEGKKEYFNALSLEDKLEIIEFSYLSRSLEETSPEKTVMIYTSKN